MDVVFVREDPTLGGIDLGHLRELLLAVTHAPLKIGGQCFPADTFLCPSLLAALLHHFRDSCILPPCRPTFPLRPPPLLLMVAQQVRTVVWCIDHQDTRAGSQVGLRGLTGIDTASFHSPPATPNGIMYFTACNSGVEGIGVPGD